MTNLNTQFAHCKIEFLEECAGQLAFKISLVSTEEIVTFSAPYGTAFNTVSHKGNLYYAVIIVQPEPYMNHYKLNADDDQELG